VIYHKYDYHDNFLPHLSWYRIYHFRCFIINTEPRDHRCNLGGQGNGVVVPVRPSVGAGGAPAVAKEEGTPAEGMVK